MMAILKFFFTAQLFCLSFFAFTQSHLRPIIQQSGRISVSVDGVGTNNVLGANVQVSKPVGGTVRNAYFFASSHSLSGPSEILDGEVLLNGTPVDWDLKEFNDLPNEPRFFHNVFADVTQHVKSTIDNAPPGELEIHVLEQRTLSINGTILVVIFDDMSQTETRGVVLFFGGQATNGDTFFIDLVNPYKEGSSFELGIGISHGFQGTTGTPMVNLIDINGARLTSSAGGEDDGASSNGSLITVGGIGDSPENPMPFDPSSHFRTDDELYQLNSFLQPGDTQIEIFSMNPTDDDDIFFAYLVTDTATAILPEIDPPGGTQLNGDLNPDLPTIILTHGLQDEETNIVDLWTGFKDTQAGGLIRSQLDPNDVNVVQYIWEEAFQPSGCFSLGLPTRDGYIAAQQNTANAGNRLAKLLVSALGQDYELPVHFIGHSLGTAVNAYAVNTISQLAPQIPNIQFTALDRPHHVTKICFLTDRDEALFGYDQDFFARVLPLNRAGVKVDNYFALDGAGVGDVASGSRVYNHLPPQGLVDPNVIDNPIFGDEGFDNSHSGVQQWYRWTMNPLNPLPSGAPVCQGGLFAFPPSGFHPSLDPCQEGWFWSIFKNPSSFPEGNGAAVSHSINLPVQAENVLDFGCGAEISENQVITVTCPSQARVFEVQRSGRRGTNANRYIAFDVSIDAQTTLSFDYIFHQTGDGDYAAVILDNDPIWVISGDSAVAGAQTSSGEISLGNSQGFHRVTVGLFSAGGIQVAELEIKNLTLSSTSYGVMVAKWPHFSNTLDLVKTINQQ